MPLFEVETPDGRAWQVDAPDPQIAEAEAMGQARANPLRGEGIMYPSSWTVDPDTNERVEGGLDWSAGFTGPAHDFGKQVVGAVKEGNLWGEYVPVENISQETLGQAMGTAGLFNPAARGAVALRRGMPTSDELIKAGRQGYKQAADMGVQYNPKVIAEFADRLEQELLEQGVVRQDAPRTYAALDDFKQGRSYQPTVGGPRDQVLPATAQNFRVLKDRLSDARLPTQTYTPSDKERFGVEYLIRAINDFIENPSPSSVVAGPATAAGQIQQIARQNLSAGKRSQTIGRKANRAELEAAAANSGQNRGNRARAKALTIADPERPWRQFGFKPDEAKALENVVLGSNPANFWRDVSNKFAGGGGVGSTFLGGGVGTGAYAAGLEPLIALALGGGTLAAGMGTRALSNKLSMGALRNVDELIRSRSPMGQAAAANPVISRAPTMANAAPLRVGAASGVVAGAPTPRNNEDLIRELLIRAAQRRGEFVI